jgi:hypothetical protein
MAKRATDPPTGGHHQGTNDQEQTELTRTFHFKSPLEILGGISSDCPKNKNPAKPRNNAKIFSNGLAIVAKQLSSHYKNSSLLFLFFHEGLVNEYEKADCTRLYFGGIAGRHCDHRRACWVASPGGSVGPRGCPTDAVLEQPQAMGDGQSQF